MSSPHESLFRLEPLREMRRAMVAIEHKIASLSKELQDYQAKFDAVKVLASPEEWAALLEESTPAEAAPEPEPSQAASQKPPKAPARKARRTASASGLLINVLRNAPGGVSHRDLAQALAGTEYVSLLENGNKGYYRVMARALKKGEVIKHANLNFHPAVYQRLKASGQLPKEEPDNMRVRAHSAAAITLGVLNDFPQGLTGPELKVKVGAHRDAPRSVREHGQYVYNILATLIGGGYVYKDGNKYRIVETARPRSNGASGSNASVPAR